MEFLCKPSNMVSDSQERMTTWLVVTWRVSECGFHPAAPALPGMQHLEFICADSLWFAVLVSFFFKF
jgi:hypothetical protein